MIKHKKLPLLHCCHIFSRTRKVYLAKNQDENYLPQTVLMAQMWGGSQTINLTMKTCRRNA